jgi:hypothetical protein
MKPKFFLKISDYQQSMAPRPLRGAFLIPPALLVVADFCSPVKIFQFLPIFFLGLSWVRFQQKEIDGAKKAAFH